MKLLSSRIIILIAILVVVLLGMVFWFTKGEAMFEAKMKPWASFQVPPGASGLDAEITVSNQQVTVCNRSQAEWSSILVQLNDSFVLKIDKLKPSACRQLSVADFASPTWKRLPPPRNMTPHSIEVLASVDQIGYLRRTF